MAKKEDVGAEKRKYPRVEEKIPVLYQVPGGEQVEEGSTHDISAGGVCFESDVFVPSASAMEVQINKPIDGGLKAILPIHANVKVIWIKQSETGKYKLGLEFTSIEEKHRKEIIRNVKERFGK